ncbi:MAG: hypothetical protein ABWY39_10565 [Mycobacterium sp.]
MSRSYLSNLSPRGDRADDRADDAVDELDYEYGYGYDEFADYDGYPPDRRWLWVAGVAAVILLIAVVGTAVILSGGDSGSVSATVAPTKPRTVVATPSSAPPVPSATSSPPSATALPPETVTTVTPAPTASAAPTPAPAEPPAVDPRTVVYQVTGNRQLIDLVTVIYTNAQGALQTDVNVALPWAKTVVLDPGVELSSVTATSVAGQLNCSITDAAGATIAAQNNNTMITTCTK